MKKKILKFNFIVLLMLLICCFSFASVKSFSYADENTVILGGMPAGFSLNTRGVYVVGLTDISSPNGKVSPCKDAGITVGDIILSINDIQINSSLDIEKAVKNTEIAKIQVKRGDENFNAYVMPKKDFSGKNKLGVFIRNNISGIGTITFFKNSRFASLGHPIQDDAGKIISITGGEIYLSTITGVTKGEKGKAGELRGVFLKDSLVGKAEKNIISGIYGEINEGYLKSKLFNRIEAKTGEAKIGNASILTTIEGNIPKEYSICIVKVDSGENKNLVIKITDQKLLEASGGIVQGMSGSPILQNGRLVGAVTHVFISDPTRGFGILINNMINN